MTEETGRPPLRRPRRLSPPATIWTPEEWARIRRGGMVDDHWWVVVDGAWIYLSRWFDTVYSARFESTEIGWRVAELWADGYHMGM